LESRISPEAKHWPLDPGWLQLPRAAVERVYPAGPSAALVSQGVAFVRDRAIGLVFRGVRIAPTKHGRLEHAPGSVRPARSNASHKTVHVEVAL